MRLAIAGNRVRCLGAALTLCILLLGAARPAAAADPQFVRLNTDAGSILVVLYPDLAPHHVDNFTHLCRTGFYDGTIFHRVIQGFMIQGGDPNSKDDDPRNDGMGGPALRDVLTDQEWQKVEQVNQMLAGRGFLGLEGRANLMSEFSTEAKHLRGTLSMARAREPHSAGSQFFICVADQPNLDGQYTIFGQVVTGMEVADAIVSAEKNPAAGRDYPANPVSIVKAEVLDGAGGLSPEEKAAWETMPAELKTAP